MKTLNNKENQFAIVAATFCLIGLALLLSVMVWHQQIDQHPWLKKGIVDAPSTNLQIAAIPAAPVVVPPIPATNSNAVPESVIQEIVTDPRNLADHSKPAAELSPAVRFLYTLESPEVFPTQR